MRVHASAPEGPPGQGGGFGAAAICSSVNRDRLIVLVCLGPFRRFEEDLRSHYDFRLFMAYRPALYARSHDIPRALYRLSFHQVRNVRDRHFR